MVQGSGVRVKSLGFRFQVLGFRFYGMSRAGLVLRVAGPECTHPAVMSTDPRLLPRRQGAHRDVHHRAETTHFSGLER